MPRLFGSPATKMALVYAAYCGLTLNGSAFASDKMEKQLTTREAEKLPDLIRSELKKQINRKSRDFVAYGGSWVSKRAGTPGLATPIPYEA